ncbi:glycosyltransferase [Candidatus Gracilibacteria bacterium]|nr:glycosyltransferase [Candidatus Gracilibacteria bacterium]
MQEYLEQIEQNNGGKKPRIAILHDAFLYRGGGERLVTLMAKALDADLVSGFFSEGSFDPRELGFTGKMIALGKPVFAKGFRHAILKYRFIEKTRFLADYDIVIFSGNCLDAVRNIPKTTKKIYYCHTPPRYIFDFRDRYMMRFPKWLHKVADRVLDREARSYTKQLSLMDHIFTNSQNVHDRLLSFCDFESEILYPPTDIDRFAPNVSVSTGNYFLSFARLSPPKRVDIIVDAFLQMPEQNLILTYGKNDPMKDEILSKIKGKDNIRAIESPNDTDLISLIQGALATIYIPIDEDFGMSPVESMACGTPVIGVNEGGLRETIVQNTTGKLIEILDSDAGIQSLKQIVQDTKKEDWESMKENSILRARDFSLDAFEKKLKSSLQIKS